MQEQLKKPKDMKLLEEEPQKTGDWLSILAFLVLLASLGSIVANWGAG